jgi:hypothetical protein
VAQSYGGQRDIQHSSQEQQAPDVRLDTSNESGISTSSITASAWGLNSESSSIPGAIAAAVAIQEAAASEVVQGTTASIGPRPAAATPGSALQPYHSIVQAVQNCQHEVLVLSGYPRQVTALALEVAGLQTQALPGAAATCGREDEFWHISRVQHEWQQQPEVLCRQEVVKAVAPSPCEQQQHHSNGSCSGSVQVVLASPTKVSQVREVLEASMQSDGSQTLQLGTSFGSSEAHGGAETAEVSEQRKGVLGAVADQKRGNSSKHLLADFYVGDWACKSPVLRARAACHPGASLLSESELAKKMGVAELDVVMDGIAWRR